MEDPRKKLEGLDYSAKIYHSDNGIAILLRIEAMFFQRQEQIYGPQELKKDNRRLYIYTEEV